MSRTRLDKLLEVASKLRAGSKAVASTWEAVHNVGRPNVVTVYHHKTAMFEYDIVERTATPLCVGRRSRSDKDGVRTILAGVGIHTTFADFYKETPPKRTGKPA